MRRGCGFTLVEVLVVVGILAALVALLIPSVGRAREQALVASCAANLRNNGQALLNYAVRNKDRLPVHFGGGVWLWDVPVATRDAIVAHGASRAGMYCPVYSEQDVETLWTFPNTTYTVTGYFWLTPRVDGTYPPENREANPPLFHWHRKLTSTRSVETELATDATLSQDGRFVNVWGGHPLPHDTSHVDGGDRPRGGNVLFMDGHAAWRPFADMKRRCHSDPANVDFWF